jgi:phospholipid/cholesterol/gamma-HCH transport system substrate-binding protein
MTKEKKVGFFVLLGIVLTTAAVFMIGQNHRLWESKAFYTATYADVAGLRPGSPVRMGGIDIGTVEKVFYKSSATDTRVYVEMSVVKEQTDRLRKTVYMPDGKTVKCRGTVARVVNKGLLGDKMMELSVVEGDPVKGCPGPVLDPSEHMDSEEPLDFGQYLAKFDAMAAKADAILHNLQEGTQGFADPQFSVDMKESVSSLHDILDTVAHKDSPVHRLLYDPKEAAKIDRILDNTEVSTRNLNGLLADAQDVTAHVKQGPGLAHALVYDGDMSSQASGSLAEVHKDLEQIRTGNGLAHALLYGDADQQHLMGNVNAMSDDLRTIVANLKAGKGTIGALLVDPSIYEDIKSIVGNVGRNQVLRALVRYSIKADEQAPPTVKVDDSKASGTR